MKMKIKKYNITVLDDNLLVVFSGWCSGIRIWIYRYLYLILFAVGILSGLSIQFGIQKSHEYNNLHRIYIEVTSTGCGHDSIISAINLHRLIGEATLDKSEFNLETAVDYIYSCGFTYPDVIIAQLKLESGSGTSKLAKSNQNLFGMKYPNSRLTTAQGVNNGYASYKTWKLSVIDRLLWEMELNMYNLPKGIYLKKLGKVYAEDKNYVEKLKKLCI